MGEICMTKNIDVMKSVPLPDLEKPRYVAVIRYQLPKRILLNGRRKTSPRFETFYGVLYWINKQPYNMDYAIYRTDKDIVLKQGYKKIGDSIK
jgi:hypothetical protein